MIKSPPVVMESTVSMLALAGSSLTGYFETVCTAGQRCLRGRHLCFGSHISHPTVDKMSPDQTESGGGDHGPEQQLRLTTCPVGHTLRTGLHNS